MTDRDSGTKYTIEEMKYGLQVIVLRPRMSVNCRACRLNNHGCGEANPFVPALRRLDLRNESVIAMMGRDTTSCGILAGLEADGSLNKTFPERGDTK